MEEVHVAHATALFRASSTTGERAVGVMRREWGGGGGSARAAAGGMASSLPAVPHSQAGARRLSYAKGAPTGARPSPSARLHHPRTYVDQSASRGADGLHGGVPRGGRGGRRAACRPTAK